MSAALLSGVYCVSVYSDEASSCSAAVSGDCVVGSDYSGCAAADLGSLDLAMESVVFVSVLTVSDSEEDY